MTGRKSYIDTTDGRRVPATIKGRPSERRAKDQQRRLRELVGATLRVVCDCRPSRPRLLVVARPSGPALEVHRAGWPGALVMRDPHQLATLVTADGEAHGRLAAVDLDLGVVCPDCRTRWRLDLAAVWWRAAGPVRQVKISGVSRPTLGPEAR